MHGKWGRLPGPLAPFLGREGYKVIDPNMPWSGTRLYDVPYGAALQELQAMVAKLRAEGAQRVVVGGESFGANGALAYQARYGDADALMLLAPGHSPQGWYADGRIKADVDRARALNQAGKGQERISFSDPNEPQPRMMTATVETYLSFFAPRGRANMHLSAQAIGRRRKAVPVLLVNSERETRVQGRAFIWNELPPHPKSVYVESPLGHSDAAEGARSDVVKFLASIASD